MANNNANAKSRLFKPSVVRKLLGDSAVIRNRTAAELSGSNILGENSFRYASPGEALKSTQQLPVDWSNFASHTFFNSAEAKTNTAFDAIINGYPFDGTKEEVEVFFDNLTGFEKYVYDEFPKYMGFLHFSGSAIGEDASNGYPPHDGTSIDVADHEGALFPTLSKKASGKSILDPGTSSISFEMQLLIPSQSIDCGPQILLQKLSEDGDGITVSVNPGASSAKTYDLSVLISSASAAVNTTTAIPKDKFNHVCAMFDRTFSSHKAKLFVDGVQAASSDTFNMKSIVFKPAHLLIGTGSRHETIDMIIDPVQTLSGTIDEFRVWHGPVNETQLKKNKDRALFTPEENNLKLYFKFNEPDGDYESNDVVLDSSGNSLHAKVSNFDPILRDVPRILVRPGDDIPLPVTLEYENTSPVLFPSHQGVIDLNSSLLAEALSYDVNNPNMITKLVPKHYLLEAQFHEGFEVEDGNIRDPYDYYGSDAVPGAGLMGQPQIMAGLLFTWARYFDEMKMFIDQASNLLHVDYDSSDVVADQFLPFLANHHGFELPNPFSNASIEQLLEGTNLNADMAISDGTLQQVQNGIWRLILTNLGEIVRSKGTLHGVKALIRSMGINPDAYFRFREYGGSRTRDLTDNHRVKTEVSTMLDFSSRLDGYSPFIISPFLSGSRIEVGYPEPAGTFVATPTPPNAGPYGYHGVSDEPSDGLFTSGSWTYEGLYKFENVSYDKIGDDIDLSNRMFVQSLARLQATGSEPSEPAFYDGTAVIANLVADYGPIGGKESTLTLFTRPGYDEDDEYLKVQLKDVPIYDGNVWHVSFGRVRNDEFDSVVSSSYFLSAGRQFRGDIIEWYSTSSLFEETMDPSHDMVWSQVDVQAGSGLTGLNTSGSFIAVGKQALSGLASDLALNSELKVPESHARTTDFSGRIAQIRFWSKALEEDERKEHLRNFGSMGVKDPLTNFNFVTTATGSFERIRLDVSTDQVETSTDDVGNITMFDFSQAEIPSGSNVMGAPWGGMDLEGTPDETYTFNSGSFFHMSGSGFEPESTPIKPERFDFGMIDPKFDEHSVDNKIRVRSFQHYNNIEELGGEVGPVYEILPSEKPQDDTRFSIDMSSVQALNEDIVKIFATLEALDNALGAPELVFATEYPDLQRLREVYFNRLTDRIQTKAFFDFFKWFDNSIGMIIEEIIPRKTKFMGLNFVIESHMLERAKLGYSYEDVYLGENNRHGLKGTILLQQFIAQLRRM